jgi:hypothetical protein
MLHDITSNGDGDDQSCSTDDIDYFHSIPGTWPIHNVGDSSAPGTVPSLDEILYTAVASLCPLEFHDFLALYLPCSLQNLHAE